MGLLLATGCIGLVSQDGPEETTDPTLAPQDAEGAWLKLTVVTVSQVPVPQATVTVEAGQERTAAETDARGLVSLGPLPPGQARVEVRHEEHQDRSLVVDLPAQGQVDRTLTLTPLTGNTTFVERFEFQGFFECSATYLIITGDCLVLARAIADQAGAPMPANATNERFAFPFELGDGWTSLEIVQTWGEPVAAAGSMMRVNLGPIDRNNTEGHGERFARAEGASPIRLTVENDGEPHEGASSEEMVLPEQGGLVRSRTFHLGYQELHDPAGTGFLGAGASLQQQFTVYVNVTYG